MQKKVAYILEIVLWSHPSIHPSMYSALDKHILSDCSVDNAQMNNSCGGPHIFPIPSLHGVDPIAYLSFQLDCELLRGRSLTCVTWMFSSEPRYLLGRRLALPSQSLQALLLLVDMVTSKQDTVLPPSCLLSSGGCQFYLISPTPSKTLQPRPFF